MHPSLPRGLSFQLFVCSILTQTIRAELFYNATSVLHNQYDFIVVGGDFRVILYPSDSPCRDILID